MVPRILLTLLAIPALALAAPGPLARLEVVRSAGAESCPSAPELEGGVSARLGYQAFHAEAEVAVEVVFRKSGAQLQARLTRSAVGAQPVVRELRGDGCESLAKSVELAIAVAIDPQSWMRPPAPMPAPPPPEPVATPEPAPPVPPVEVSAPAPVVVAPEVDAWRPMVGLGGAGAIGTGPAPTAGGTVHLGLGKAHLAFALELRPELAASLPTGGGRIVTSQLVGTALGCGRLAGFGGCALVSVGRFVAHGEDVLAARSADAPLVALGARLEKTFELSRHLAVVPHVDVAVPVTHLNVLVGDEVVWRAPVVQGSFGLQLRVRFW